MMIRFMDVRNFDRASLALLAGALISLSSAITLSVHTTFVEIPDPSLDLIRGLNPMIREVNGPNCTDENVYTETVFDPPGSPPSVVAGNNCAGVANGTKCIFCINGRQTHYSEQGGGPPGIFPTPTIVDCGLNRTGQEGTCAQQSDGTHHCVFASGYTCATTGADYPAQPKSQ